MKVKERLDKIDKQFNQKPKDSLTDHQIAWLIEQAKKAIHLEDSIKDINNAVSYYEERGWKVKSVVEYLSCKAVNNEK